MLAVKANGITFNTHLTDWSVGDCGLLSAL